ncbi:MAG: MotA/TolQ/ExbB proton channel family protein [Gomphosphaeria aponina SAG 52.96 = DSM 107014]|uniref:MotA/TolQ/ExbB proton channel family protein n=1 Tax=Gomphosphaeria aponina SAG 52.96 = DSM 107014 TaxID=1521640 RepID=A0A941GPY3_9CHRO|nr:MotA/TolQ/ExbB proton channel family protein [Gomphosphaeria aponina SAG 52.96 = DSM 107014]
MPNNLNNLLELFKAGGIVAWPLLGFSLLAVALSIERIWFWFRIKSQQKKVVKEVLRLYRSEDSVTAMEKLKENAALPIARIFLEALELEEPTPEEFRLALESATQAELPDLKRFNTLFQTIITVSPLLGLLGTILGLMHSFASLNIGNASATDRAGVTGGISEALVSTVMGLVVAISTLLFANAFRSFYQRQIGLIQEYGGQLELLYCRIYYKKGGKTYADY